MPCMYSVNPNKFFTQDRVLHSRERYYNNLKNYSEFTRECGTAAQSKLGMSGIKINSMYCSSVIIELALFAF